MRDKIAELLESRKDDLVKFLREIISTPSPSGGEGAVVQRIREEMEALGYDEVAVDPLGNLLGRIGGGDRILAIDGHCDTVGVGNADNWTFDPFGAALQDGVIYGRGAADQKSGLAAAVHAGGIVREIGLPDDVSLLVVASVLEEDFEGLCWRYIIEDDGFLPEAVLLTEPSCMQLRLGQRGRLEMKVRTRGVSSHGSAPRRGVNALYKIAPIVTDVERLDARLRGPSPLGKGTVAVTDISSSAPSLCAVPDEAVIHLDRRLTEGETESSSLAEIADLESFRWARANVFVPEYDVSSYTGLKHAIKAYYPMWLIPSDDPPVALAAEVYRTRFAREAELGYWAFSTNGVATRGAHGIPTIGFGPGEEAHAHSPDERVSVSDVIAAAEYYAAFAVAWSEQR